DQQTSDQRSNSFHVSPSHLRVRRPVPIQRIRLIRRVRISPGLPTPGNTGVQAGSQRRLSPQDQRCFIFLIASRSLLPSGTPRPVPGSQPFPALKAPLLPWMTSKKAEGLAYATLFRLGTGPFRASPSRALRAAISGATALVPPMPPVVPSTCTKY